MLGDTCQKHTFFGDVGIVGRMSGKLFDDTTLKSYAYWYDPDELMRVRLGRRGQPDHEPTLKEKLLNFFIWQCVEKISLLYSINNWIDCDFLHGSREVVAGFYFGKNNNLD